MAADFINDGDSTQSLGDNKKWISSTEPHGAVGAIDGIFHQAIYADLPIRSWDSTFKYI